jgi:hypothetical protein
LPDFDGNSFLGARRKRKWGGEGREMHSPKSITFCPKSITERYSPKSITFCPKSITERGRQGGWWEAEEGVGKDRMIVPCVGWCERGRVGEKEGGREGGRENRREEGWVGGRVGGREGVREVLIEVP